MSSVARSIPRFPTFEEIEIALDAASWRCSGRKVIGSESVGATRSSTTAGRLDVFMENQVEACIYASGAETGFPDVRIVA